MAMNTNEFRVAGTLVKKSIILGRNKETRKEWAMANLELEVGENKRVTLSIFANQKTSSGTDSKIYQNLLTIRDEYKSLDSEITDKRTMQDAKPFKHEATTVKTKEECDFVVANKGIKVSMNHYMRDGELQSSFRLSTNFVNRESNPEKRVPGIEGNLIGVVVSEKAKVSDDGKSLTVEVAVPEYRQAYGDRPDSVVVDKFELVLRDQPEDAMEYCAEIFVENTVCCLGVEPITMVISDESAEQSKPRGFGKIPTFNSTKIVRELRIIGAYDLEEQEYANDPAFDFDLYTQALKEYEDKIEQIKAGGGETQTFTKGFGKGQAKEDKKLPF